MKGLLAVTVMAVVFVTIKGEENVKRKIAKAFENCKGQNSITDDELNAMKKEDLSFAFSHSAKCLIACMLEEGKILKDGKYSKENALIMADVVHIEDADEANKARQVLENCAVQVPEVGPDPCEFAFKMAECGAKEAKKLGMKEHDFFE